MTSPDRNTQNRDEQITFNTGLNALFYASELVDISPTAPQLLSGNFDAWLVANGSVDIFAVPLENGQPCGARTHVCRIEANHAVFGVGADDSHAFSQGVIAVP